MASGDHYPKHLPKAPPPRSHDEFACKLRLDGMTRLSTWDKIKLALKLRNLIQDPAMKDRIQNLLSRKFIALIVGSVLVTTLNHLGVSSEVTQQIVALVVGYIAGQGVVDAVVAAKAKPPLKHEK